MRLLAAVGLIGVGWLAVRPRTPYPRPPVTLADVEIAIYTRELTVIADGRRLLTGGPVPDRAALASMTAAAFEAQLRAALMGANRG